MSGRIVLTFLLWGATVSLLAQSPLEQKWMSQWRPSNAIPEKLLAGRTMVLHTSNFSEEELAMAQTVFQQTGIDVVGYFDVDHVLSGVDVVRGFANYFNRRQIAFLALLHKDEKGFLISIVSYNRKPSLTDEGAGAWQVRSVSFREALIVLYTTASRTLKRENFLVSELPEQDLRVGFIRGDRQEICLPNVRSVRIAVPRFANPAETDSLTAFLKTHFPVKYQLVDPDLSDRQLIDQGFTYVLRFLYTRGALAKQLLQYEIKPGTTLATATYPQGQLVVKTIPAQAYVYKFYLKELEYSTFVLGSQWDADLTWKEALLNHIHVYRADRRL